MNIVDNSLTCSFTISPLATTCPTDWSVPPIIADVFTISWLYKYPHKTGSKNIKNIPVIFTTVIVIPLSSSLASITGAVAAIADEPHTAFPLAISILKFWLKPNFLPIYIAPTIVIVICIIIKDIPLNPNSISFVTLKVPPSSTIEYDNRLVSENLYPLWNTFCPNNKFPTNIPKNIAIVPAPKLGANLDNPILIKDTNIDTISPGSISFVAFNILLFLLISSVSPLRCYFCLYLFLYYPQINISSKTKYICII